MFKLTVATLAALYGILYVFGDESRRPEQVSRAEPLALSVVPASAVKTQTQSPSLAEARLSQREAVQMALAAGKKLRDERRKAPLATIGTASYETAVAEEITLVAAQPVNYWYVTGSRVNLRKGPGTGNAVVGQVTWATEAEVLSEKNGWYEIRLSDGFTSGWIFGKFLNDQRPG
ncbi:MAG: SH3 domain-containing protein [Paracoccaceae bacterium]|nr:SH3 domain-containing protein [Paracoccaceae bacterium]